MSGEIGNGHPSNGKRTPLLTGTKVGRVRLESLLGEGGMGQVYLGQDEDLDRFVAVKILHQSHSLASEQRQRFKREARILAKLDHPNICRVFDLVQNEDGEAIILEYVEGKTLRQKIEDGLSMEEKLDYAKQIISALVAAHRESIIHRDLKPENIIIREDGVLKVLDFGLARWEGTPTSASKSADKTSLMTGDPDMTTEGTLLGTLAYMSPEQANGEILATSSDMYSLGILFHELFFSEQAYEYKGFHDLLLKVTTAETNSLKNHTGPIVQTIQSLVVLDPESRPSASQVLKILGGIKNTKILQVILAILIFLIPTTSTLVSILSNQSGREPKLVMLPFVLPEPGQTKELERGLIVDLSSNLSKLSGITLLESHEAPPDLDELAFALSRGADYALGGRISQNKTNNVFNLDVKLIELPKGRVLWVQTYQKAPDEVANLVPAITTDLAQHLGLKSTNHQGSPQKKIPHTDPDAYHAYLRALAHNHILNHDRSEYMVPLKLFLRAIDLDPEFSQAHARASRIYSSIFIQGVDRGKEIADQAESHARTAMDLAPEEPDGLLAWGLYQYRVKRNDEEALSAFKKVKEKWPGLIEADLLMAFVYRRQGQLNQARGIFDSLVKKDPKNVTWVTERASTYFFLKDFQKARELFRESIALQPDQTTAYIISAWNEWRDGGNIEEAGKFLNSIPDTSQPFVRYFLYLQNLYSNQPEKAIEELEMIPGTSVSWQAWFYPKALLRAEALFLEGEKNKAHDAYKEAVDQLEAEVIKSPEDFRYHSALSWALSRLDRHNEAMEQIQLSLSQVREEHDLLNENYQELHLLQVLKQANKPPEAKKLEQNLLIHNVWLTQSWMNLDPRW